MPKTWDIFCSVVDNFGDIGVCWRLSRQLVAEHQIKVKLWVDDLQSFTYLCSEVDPKVYHQQIQGVEIYHWHQPWSATSATAADVVIEAFGCHLPNDYVESMLQRSPHSLWLNLEYLSAESWVENCHALPSPQLKGPAKYFFFPGFTQKTGGLIREQGLIEKRQKFQNSLTEKIQFLQQIGITAINSAINSAIKDTQLISLFSYENLHISHWLDDLVNSQKNTHLVVPQGRIVDNLLTWIQSIESSQFSLTDFLQGKNYCKGSLTIQLIPFLSQDDYDRLLWSCDFNVVRGEDSFVRAQWAGKPFLWHIYPQQDKIHLHKLEAFLELYCQNLTKPANNALRAISQAWNQDDNMKNKWSNMLELMPELTENAENWCFQQAKQINIAETLVQFYQNWLKYSPKI